MKICVEIELDTKTNEVKVGVRPKEAGKSGEYGGEDRSHLQPSESVEAALETARELLTNPQAQAAEAALAVPSEPEVEQQAASESFARTRGY